MSEKPGFPAHSRISWEAWQTARMLGWRYSADRTNLRGNSLLTGNFTGNFAIFGDAAVIREGESTALQPLLRKISK
jgi:hypothetical protein